MKLNPGGVGYHSYMDYHLSVKWADAYTGHVYDNILAAGDPHATFTVGNPDSGDEPTYEDFKAGLADWVEENGEWLVRRAQQYSHSEEGEA